MCPNRTNGKDSRGRLTTNFLSITCCTIKAKKIRYFVTNCCLAQLVGLSHAELLVLGFEFGRSSPEGSLSFCSFFLVSFLSFFFRVTLRVRIRFRVSVSVRVRIRVKVSFEPSSPIVRELVLSLTRFSFPLVRFRHNQAAGSFGTKVILISVNSKWPNGEINDFVVQD